MSNPTMCVVDIKCSASSFELSSENLLYFCTFESFGTFVLSKIVWIHLHTRGMILLLKGFYDFNFIYIFSDVSCTHHR